MGANYRIWLSLTWLAAACLAGAGTVRAQESWGGRTTSSSTWGGGSSAATSSSSPRAAVSGGSSSWIAGGGSVKTGAAAGGVWSEGSGLPAAGGVPTKSPAPAGLSTTPGITHLKTTSAAPARTPSAASSVHKRPSGMQRAQNAKGGTLPNLGRAKTAASKGGSHSRGRIDFKGNAANTTFGGKKSSQSTPRKPNSLENPGGLTEPTGPTEPVDPTDLDRLPQ